MANDIKIDKLNTPLIVEPRAHQQRAPIQAIQAEEGVIVSPHMGKLAQLINDNEEISTGQDRVAAVKRQIETNDYHVDLDQLSEKLMTHGILLTKGE